ncbi:hypothetical protein [uncultured Cellulomonas sp.]|uniref:hypothetical protein n=1 Tax=uncultured Cellulomonas sp. TaxID=189682 RepID=UPI00261F50B0|nr:hypothetical protein [uncultured Cellulomonas sp.]
MPPVHDTFPESSMRHVLSRRAAALGTALLLTLGAAPASAASASTDGSLSAASTTQASTAAATITPWTTYEWPFSSLATCQARGRTVLSIYGGSHHGAIHSVQCNSGTVPNMCGTVIRLQVRYVNNPGGPLVADPSSTLSAVAGDRPNPDSLALAC